MIDIQNYDKAYFSNIQNCKHYFGDQSLCQWCFNTNIEQFVSQNKIISELFPEFKELNFMLNKNNGTSKIFKKALVEISVDKNKSQSLSSISYMNPEINSSLKLKFIQNDYNEVGVKLSLN